MTASPNYTEELYAQVKALYAQYGNEGLEKIAQEINKPVRSVRSKLVKEGDYVPSDMSAKKNGPSKKELLLELDGVFGDEIEVYEAFKNTTKTGLQFLVRKLKPTD